MKEEGKTSKRPLSEAFGEWSNAKIAILALLGATAGEAVVWYGGQFYALFFLTQTHQGAGGDGADHDRDCAGARHARLHHLRLAVGQDRPQADHSRRLPAGGADVFPDLQGNHPLRQSEARNGACGVAGDGDRRSRRMLVPVQGDRHRKIHHQLRRGQIRAGQPVGELQQSRSAEGHAGFGQDRRSDLDVDLARLRQGVCRRRSRPMAIRPQPIRPRSTQS